MNVTDKRSGSADRPTVDRLRGVVYGPKTLKIWNFTNLDLITPKGRVPCTILTKFTEFMHVLSLGWLICLA